MRNNLKLKEEGKLPEGYDVDPGKIRQGDVYLVERDGLEKSGQPRKDRTVALGEATGHHHTLEAGTVFGEREGVQVVVVDEPTKIGHQEHGTLPVRVGESRVDIQRQHTPAGVERQAD